MNTESHSLFGRSKCRLLVLSTLFFASSFAYAEDPVFQLEPSFRATVATTRTLPAGTILKFSAPELKANEALLVQRCGTPCNTAKLVRALRKSNFERSEWQSISLSENGIYYFWIQRQLENGEIGPVLGESSRFEGMKGVVRFASGINVSVAVELPDPIATAPLPAAEEFAARAKMSSTRHPNYEMGAVQAFWGDATFMQQCVPQGTFPLPAPFKIYVEILADGSMGRTFSVPMSKTAECVHRFTAGRIFPKPPEPYVLAIELSFKR